MHALAGRVMHHADAAVVLVGVVADEPVNCRRVPAVVDDHVDPVGHGLVEHGTDGALEQQRPVAGAGDDGHAGLGWR